MSRSHGLRLAVLLVLSCIGTATAGGHKAEMLEVNQQHWDVKGIVLGSTFDDLKSQQPDLVCSSISPIGPDNIDQRCYVGKQKCDTTSSSVRDYCHDAQTTISFAGHATNVSYGIHENIVWEISLLTLDPDAFDSVVSAMESKYGKPALEKTDIQNRMGAHFEQAVAVWSGLDHILYRKYRDRLDQPSDLKFYSDAAWVNLQSIVKDRQESAKNDM